MSEDTISVVQVTDPDERTRIVREVLLDLPEWFGLPESTEAYISEARELPLWAALDADTALGFVTLSQSSEDCGEVHCMGVKKARHRQGIGKLLLDALIDEAGRHYAYLQVKTVDEGRYVEYD